MGHRWGQRVQAAIRVKLRGRPGAIGSGCIRDLSISGTFVETGLSLPLLTRVEIDTGSQGRASMGSRRLSGRVVRRNAIGFGVEWCEFAPKAVLTLLAQTQLLRPDWRTVVVAQDEGGGNRSRHAPAPRSTAATAETARLQQPSICSSGGSTSRSR